MWFDTILWLVAIVAFIAVETATTALVSVWFAIGAAAAMFASFFTSSLGIQAAVFAVVSAVGILLSLLIFSKFIFQSSNSTQKGEQPNGKTDS